MSSSKEQLFKAALALNGPDKKYRIIVTDDKIITRVKWMDTTFFSPYAVTDEMRQFEYVVQVHNNGKYTELDKSAAVTKSAKGSGMSYQKSMFVGKQITFDKTIGVGHNKQTGETGIINTAFYSEEYKKPVRALLQNAGYKKKMGKTGKIFIGAAVFAVLAILAAVVFLVLPLTQKEAISASDFEDIAESFGYVVVADEETEDKYDYVRNILIALDEEDEYQIDFYVLEDADYAKSIFENNKEDFEDLVKDEEKTITSAAHSSIYTKYEASTDSLYLYLARIDNTVLYVDVDIECKYEIEEFIKEIGY